MEICQEDMGSSLKKFLLGNLYNLNIKTANERNGYNTLGEKRNASWYEKSNSGKKVKEKLFFTEEYQLVNEKGI